ncbi:MAG: hypothetical protein EB072_03985 [Betaproteobacteria bacterium]|nr:hypothetical protein [Betaproteobacteria bacterium]
MTIKNLTCFHPLGLLEIFCASHYKDSFLIMLYSKYLMGKFLDCIYFAPKDVVQKVMMQVLLVVRTRLV